MDILAHPENKAGRDLVCIYREVLRAVAADAIVFRTVSLDGQQLRLGDAVLDLGRYQRLFVLGAGKASAAMATAMETILGDRIAGGAVVTKYGHALPSRRIRMLEAGHPVPDENSVAAGRALAELADEFGDEDAVVFLLSGGASALMELPVEGVTLEDMQTATRLLLRCGATIQELNAVRCRLSRIKGGGLARLLAPAHVICLVLSDVLGNPLSVIGSGPCWVHSSRNLRPAEVVNRYGLANDLPAPVLRALQESGTGRDDRGAASASVEHIIIGDIHTATTAAADAARALGHAPLVLTTTMMGEAREIGTLVGGMAHDLPALSSQAGINCLILGGEPTVTVRGDGRGGRGMELASAAALVVDGDADIAILAAGTDGTDGPTDAAGALVHGTTAGHARQAGYPLEAALVRSDTYHALDKVGALVRTGPTGSNVGDVVIVLHAPSGE